MKAHFIHFLSPGTFVHEESSKPIDEWNPEKGKAMARDIKERHNATPFAFYFTTRERQGNELDSRVVETSGRYYLGGVVETLEQVKARATDKHRVLISNMEGNGYDRIITNKNSWQVTQPLGPTDVVLEWENIKADL